MMVLLRLSAGLIGWAVAFCVIYALHGLGCADAWDATRFRWVLLLAWGLSIVATLIVAVWLTRRRATALDRTAAALGWVGVAATLITFLPVAIVPACA